MTWGVSIYYIVLTLFDIIINTCESKSLESVKVNNKIKKGIKTMSLKDKLNIKQATKTTSKKSSIENDLHQTIYNAINKALKDSEYYKQNLTIDTFVQDDDNKVKLVEVRNANCIVIPVDNVKLKNGEKTHTINKAMKVGEVQVYFKGIKKQIAEYEPTPK